MINLSHNKTPKYILNCFKNNMFLTSSVFIALLILFINLSYSWAATSKTPLNQNKKHRELIFSDEFTQPTLNKNTWNTHYPWGRTNSGNHEAELYLDELVSQQNGNLILTSDRSEKFKFPNDIKKSDFPFASGMVTTHGKHTFQYGYFETRAKVPQGQGIWPAFWLHIARKEGWLPEIDVMEFLGHLPTRMHMTQHFTENNNHAEQTCAYTGPNFPNEFHTYAVDWRPNSLTYYIDGIERCHFTQSIPKEPMYLILNLAVGGDWPGYPNASTVFPQEFQIDYVRVYK